MAKKLINIPLSYIIILALAGVSLNTGLRWQGKYRDNQLQTLRNNLTQSGQSDIQLLDEKGKLKQLDPKQLQAVKGMQTDRLKVDMASLADGSLELPFYAELLYGENYQQQIEHYRGILLLRNISKTVSVCLIALAALLAVIKVLVHFFLKKNKTNQSNENSHIACPVRTNSDSHAHKARPLVDKSVKNRAVNKLDDAKKTESHEVQRFDTDKAAAEVTPAKLNPFVAESLNQSGSEGYRTAGAIKERSAAASSVKEKNNLWDDVPSKTPKVAMMMSTEPVSKSLNELSQEMSAIREYASKQQDHMQKLQDGYDWALIKRFCLRFIRCIDNIDSQIRQLSEMSQDVCALEDIRDELLFAFESSGVEKYEPEPGSDFSGQEKLVEVMGQKELTDDKALFGKVAAVNRSGYKYIVDDTNFKVVRSAQVRLYG